MITEVPDFDLRAHNTFRMAAHCRSWIEYTSPDDLPAIFSKLDENASVKHIGAGSNLLFLNYFDGIILHSRILDVEMNSVACSQHVDVRCGAGVDMDALVERCAAAGIWGLENLSGIPGEVGSSAVQNVGAYGVEAGDLILEVECFDRKTHRFTTLSADDCRFAYRDSMFKHPENSDRYVITHVTFRLSTLPYPRLGYGNLAQHFAPDATPSAMEIRRMVIDVRATKLPSVDQVGSAGSFFKNPIVDASVFEQVVEKAKSLKGPDYMPPHFAVGENRIKIPAAWLIDNAGLKGTTCGGAAVWHSQPLVIVNASGSATPAEVVGLENTIVKRVKEVFAIELKPEVEHIGCLITNNC